MKKFKYMVFFIGIFLLAFNVQAKNTLFSCEYYKQRDSLGGTPQIAILCDIYDNYSHMCYVKKGDFVVTRSDNKESIQNWTSAVGLSWKAKEYVQSTNSCPPFILAQVNSGINGYEIHAAKDATHLSELQSKLYGTRYVVPLKGNASEEERENAIRLIKNSIDKMDDIMSDYSFEACVDWDKVITRLEDCKDQIDSLKNLMKSYKETRDEFVRAGTLKEDDDIIVSFDQKYKDAEQFVKDEQETIDEEQENIDREMGLLDPEEPDPDDSTTNPSRPDTEVNEVEISDITMGRVCKSSNLKTPLKYIGWLLSAAKIIVPIVIIALGVMDFLKAVASQKQDELSKAIKTVFVRVIAGIIIFLVPAIINFLVTLVDEWSSYKTAYSECTECLVNPKNC